LAELFEADIDGAMQSLGHCCGRKYVFSPQVLCCFGKGLCPIPRDTVYYVYDNRYLVQFCYITHSLQDMLCLLPIISYC